MTQQDSCRKAGEAGATAPVPCRSGFLRMFVPGLVVGLVVGGFAGATLPALLVPAEPVLAPRGRVTSETPKQRAASEGPPTVPLVTPDDKEVIDPNRPPTPTDGPTAPRTPRVPPTNPDSPGR